MNNYEKGREYEEKAAAYLISQGYNIVTANYRSRHAQIDIIAMEDGVLAFVEVKYRKSASPQDPLEAVDAKKQRRISSAASQYLMEHGGNGASSYRFDVVSFLGGKPTLIRNAFDFAGPAGF
ncbi:MAG: YraN family protein [Lachnospiraceae bacterium]|nr:YraN family protein [Lachnospiraceae bacterium]